MHRDLLRVAVRREPAQVDASLPPPVALDGADLAPVDVHRARPGSPASRAPLALRSSNTTPDAFAGCPTRPRLMIENAVAPIWLPSSRGSLGQLPSVFCCESSRSTTFA